jgi:nicotinate-nucleotide adenylyltransferase
VNVGVFGGSFNPPHVGHVLACALVVTTQDVERLLVVPTYRHPFAKDLAPYEDRVRMCELAVGHLLGVDVSRVEEELGGESRTLRTLEHLAGMHPDWRLRLIIGSDLLGEAPRWFRFDAIEKLAPPLVLARAGADPNENVGRVQLPEVSSTYVRDAVRRGAWSELAEIVPRKVLAYIRVKGLYGAAP